MRAFSVALVLASLALTGCDSRVAQSILPGEWEVIRTPPQMGDDKPKEPIIRRHCISPEDARKPSLRAMINPSLTNHSPEDEAIVANGRITGNTTIDMPDGDIRGIPVEIDGIFSEDQFSFRSTLYLYGQQITTTFEGSHIGHCKGRRTR